ncbi:DUF3467 domain-containing protein [Herminiimonas aquatilis]|uniref:DUF3467 domain-containing protein n=1 Tax=Herminiimonas aquatilis TaxID=345342 RepID=A0ABW2J143_9BURK
MAKSKKENAAAEEATISAAVTEVASSKSPALEKTAKAASVEAVSVPIKPRWDDSKMQSAYANVCNVLGTREEITLLFGTNKAWQAGSDEVGVQLSQRIVLTPYTAKRLSQMMEQGVREYEQRFGEIKLS